MSESKAVAPTPSRLRLDTSPPFDGGERKDRHRASRRSSPSGEGRGAERSEAEWGKPWQD
ncbi:hypothetical protein Amn_40750 [Aminobacter sp. Y103A]|nr:hypothetical protein Amn_40750 [Aminobacter sp. SS-2016]